MVTEMKGREIFQPSEETARQLTAYGAATHVAVASTLYLLPSLTSKVRRKGLKPTSQPWHFGQSSDVLHCSPYY